MPRTSSSGRETSNAAVSGTAAPSTRRRASCPAIDAHRNCDGSETRKGVGSSAIDTPQVGDGGSGLPPTQTQAGTDSCRGIAVDGKDEAPFKCSIAVPTSNGDANDEEIDVSALTDADLRRLKRDDPFTYYSVPAARRRSSWFQEGEDDGPIEASRRPSLPAEVLLEADVARSRRGRGAPAEGPSNREPAVRRNSRFSTEAHPSLVCGEMVRELRELGDSDMDEDLDMLEIDLESMFENNAF